MYSYCIISNMKQYTQDEISKHNTVNDCWIYSDNNVYNIIEFIEYTPKDLKNPKKIFNYEDTKTLLLSKMSNVFNYFWKSN